MAGAGEREGGEIAEDVPRRRVGACGLGLAAQRSGSGQSGLPRSMRQVEAKSASVLGATRTCQSTIASAGSLSWRRRRGHRHSGLVDRAEGRAGRGGFAGLSGLPEAISGPPRSAGRGAHAGDCLGDRKLSTVRGGWVGRGGRRVAGGRHAPDASVGHARPLRVGALAAQNRDAALLGQGRGARQRPKEQEEGEVASFHSTNRRQVIAASQWQVAHLAGPGGGAYADFSGGNRRKPCSTDRSLR